MNFTYLLGWTKQTKYYYGCRFAKNATPDSLWVTYFTSSKRVKDFAVIHGPPDVIQIRKIFNSSDGVRNWESKVLKRLHIRRNPDKWLNISENKAIVQTQEVKNKIKSKIKGRIFTVEHKQKLSQAMKLKGLDLEYTQNKSNALKKYFASDTGKKQHAARVARSRQINLGRIHSEQSRKNMSKSKLGMKQSEQTKLKRREWYLTPDGIAFRQRQSERAKSKRNIT